VPAACHAHPVRVFLGFLAQTLEVVTLGLLAQTAGQFVANSHPVLVFLGHGGETHHP